MYKFIDESGIEVTWEPLNSQVGKEVVAEITGGERIEVTAEEREKILNLYAERVPNVVETEKEVEKDEITLTESEKLQYLADLEYRLAQLELK